MQIRCYRCGWNFGLSNDELVFALEAIEAGQASHYDARCPRCRTINKVAAEQIRRGAPKPAAPPEAPAG